MPLVLILPGFFGATPLAQAQVKRCSLPDGTPLYTDRRCADLGAVERVPRESPGGGAKLPYRGGCTRQLQDLIFELGSAIDAGDANRLASLYHWPGLSSRTGYAVVGRLEAIARRPLVDLRALHAPSTQGGDGAADPAPDYYPQSTTRRRPIGLRIEQTLSDGVTPARTTFSLRRHMGCWWISL
ncbi:hypothetical protein [Luteimonas vadosa]|uniref:DUF4124 domain-containing protein n=1 Tax=Luteimonas vadosa TaxID=1165507 RepID=A0ABP9DWF4_9GAMM